MNALFGRKIQDLRELKEFTKKVIKNGNNGESFIIVKEVLLDDKDFQKFTSDFLKDQPWISKDDGGKNEFGELRCIRVTNKNTVETIIVNTEGYDYPRYTAMELQHLV